MTKCNLQITKNCNYCIKGKMCPKQTRVWMLQMTAVCLLSIPCSRLSRVHTGTLTHSAVCWPHCSHQFWGSVSCVGHLDTWTPGHLDRSSYCDRPNCCPENTSSFSSFIKETLLEWCVGVKMCDYVKEIFCQTIRPKSQRYSLVKHRPEESVQPLDTCEEALFLRSIWHFIN